MNKTISATTQSLGYIFPLLFKVNVICFQSVIGNYFSFNINGNLNMSVVGLPLIILNLAGSGCMQLLFLRPAAVALSTNKILSFSIFSGAHKLDLLGSLTVIHQIKNL